MKETFRKPTYSYRAIVGSLSTSWTVILGTTSFTFLIGVSHTWLFKTMPRLAILGATGAVFWGGMALAIALLSSSAHSMINIEVLGDRGTHSLWMTRVPAEITGSFLVSNIVLRSRKLILLLSDRTSPSIGRDRFSSIAVFPQRFTQCDLSNK